MLNIFFKRIHKFKQNLATSSVDQQTFESVFELQNSLEQNLSNIPVLVESLQKFFRAQPVNLELTNRLRQCSATIFEPRNNVDNPIRFSAGLVLAVDFVASLENVDDVSNVYLKVSFPSG